MAKRCSKRRFPNKEAAEYVGTRATARHSIPFRAYRCPHCHGWHLTKNRDHALQLIAA